VKIKILAMVLTVAVCLGLLLVPVTPTALAQGGTAGIEIQPSKAKVGFAESFTVDVSINNAANDDVNTVGVMINFTPGLINATGITVNPLWTLVTSQTYNNTAGTIDVAAGILGSSSTASSIPVCTIDMVSDGISGIANINLVNVPGVRESKVLTVAHGDILNWTLVVNGTVKVGTTTLKVCVNPVGNGGVEANGTPLVMTAGCNTTTWDWDQNVTLLAVNSTPGWGFVNWTEDLVSTDNPENITMDALTKNVTANFEELPPAILADPSSLTFSASVGEDPANQTLDICNDGGHILNWTLNDGPGWLIVRPLSGGDLGAEDCNSTEAGVNTTGLAEGTYHANITITAAGASNSPHVVPVTLNIGVPEISVNPRSLTFTTSVGVNPPSQKLEVCNSGTGTLDWELTDNAGWLGESPTSGSLDEDECEDVTVSVDVSGMEAGDYTATITITGSDEEKVPVTLHIVSAMPEMPVGPASVSASGLSITPQQVQPGRDVTISINVANTGGETGSYNAVLYINGVVEDS